MKRKRKRTQLSMKARKKLIESGVYYMGISEVVALECALQGRTEAWITRNYGDMTQNQWRNALCLSLGNLLWFQSAQ